MEFTSNNVHLSRELRVSVRWLPRSTFEGLPVCCRSRKRSTFPDLRFSHRFWCRPFPGGEIHRQMATGGYGLPKVSPGPALSYPSTPCGWATPETALWPFLGWPACMAGGLRLSYTFLDTPCHMPIMKTTIRRMINVYLKQALKGPPYSTPFEWPWIGHHRAISNLKSL
jgi:hypothetical protein